MALANVPDPKNMQVHKNDIISTISKLEACYSDLQNLSYFLKLALEFSAPVKSAKGAPKIAIVGLEIPEELIYGARAEPLWILGGSFGAALYADPLVPRDTDSVSKATLGYLFSEIFNYTEKAVLTVIPIATDSMRKIAYMLSKKREVLAIDIPPVKENSESARKWLAQMDCLRTAVEQKTKHRLSIAGLRTAVTMVNAAKMQMKRTLAYSINNPEQVSGVLALFLIDTYYFANQLPEWTTHLKALNDEIASKIEQNQGSEKARRPRVMVAGSPVYFPNFKIPLLLQELNVHLSAYVHEMTRRIELLAETPEPGTSLSKWVEKIVLNHYWADCSAAFADSKTRLEYMRTLTETIPLNGVVYHVLKGQIEYDFELERCESYFSKRDIPLLRVETDFHQQDIEQIKVRLEAFTEMMEDKFLKTRG
ncbi:MAG: 2-hydroxyacyl-CoA dehydratase family protein [Bacillota bacterium]|jgi:benzoyl-CoA reductase/2-hydroxyglutaryl-CoA dehydratase subunit BcrC/BadD/HgdB